AGIARQELEAANITDGVNTDWKDEGAEDICTFGRQRIRLGQGHHQIGFPEPPSSSRPPFAEARVGAFRRASLHPTLNDSDFCVARMRLTDERAVVRPSLPGRHEPAGRSRRDLKGMLPCGLVGREVERAGPARMMTLGTVPPQQRPNVVAKSGCPRFLRGSR